MSGGIKDICFIIKRVAKEIDSRGNYEIIPCCLSLKGNFWYSGNANLTNSEV